VQRGVDLGKELRRKAPPDEAERKVLFGQTATSATQRPD
jgi:GST-like protein